MPDPLPLTDEHLLDAFHPVAAALSGLEYSELWDVQVFAHRGIVLHVTQLMEGSVFCRHCRSNACVACLYLLANGVRF
jgi:hypothetical protein